MVFGVAATPFVNNTTYNPFPPASELGMVAADLVNSVDNHLIKKHPFNKQKIYECTNYLLSSSRGLRSADTHHLVAQQIRHGIKHARNTNSILYRNWLDNCVGRLKIGTSDKQDLLTVVVGFRVHSTLNTFEKLSDYTLKDPSEGGLAERFHRKIESDRNTEILQKCLERCKEKNGAEKLLFYRPFIENCLRNQQYMNFGVSARQELLETMLAKDTYYDSDLMAKICDYSVQNAEEGERNLAIIKTCIEKTKENNGFNKIVAYRPIIDNCFRNQQHMNINTAVKQDLLTQMMQYSGACKADAFSFFASYHLENNDERKKQGEIEQIINKDLKEYWLNSNDLRRISLALGGFCAANPDMSLHTFNQYTNNYLQILNEENRSPDLSLIPLLQVMEARVKIQPNNEGKELFSEQESLPETIDKRLFGEFLNQVLTKTSENGGIKNSSKQFLDYTSKMMLHVMKNHSFSKKEMLSISRTIKASNFQSETTEAYYANLNMQMQQIYNEKLEREVLDLGKWVQTQKLSTLADRLALRSTYVDVLHERLVNDKSVGGIKLDDALSERQQRFQEDMSENFEKDKLRANRIIYAVKGPYRNKSFVNDITKTTSYLDKSDNSMGFISPVPKVKKTRS